MPKRKRSSPPPTQKIAAPPPAKRAKYCEKCIVDAQKPLLQALRHGSVLERQKHSRRKKYATKKNDRKAIERLEAEYTVLKALNLEQLADQHLRKTLARVKSLKDAEPLREYIAGIREGSKDTNTLNVTARLFKVVQVKKVVDGVIEELKGILEVGKSDAPVAESKTEFEKKPKNIKAAKAVEKQDVEMKEASDGEDDPYMAFSARIAEPSSGEEDSAASVTDDERPPSIADSENDHDPEDDLEADSESEGDDEEGTSFEGFSSDDKTDTSIPTKKSKTKLDEAKSISSAFLPALSHAAYFSGSESEASDLDEDVAPRKNRRGQRARQKIAELKFGQKAKHLEKAQRNAGWDPKRGAVSDDKRQRKGKPTTGRGPQQSGTNAEPLGDRRDKKDRKMGLGVKRDDKGELHPSWQAAKMAKESKKLKIDLSGSKMAGKKVVFD
ncbi:BUD22 multi-domain protein [Pyrenophora tritici-repentis]|nr:BUD22 multi-domain protein [Pyrenophora tritici-repentis]